MLLHISSKNQTVVYHSSTEVEYHAFADTISELLWLPWLFEDLGLSDSSAIPLYCDNHSALQISQNDVFHEHAKYIKIDYHFTCQYVFRDIVHLIPILFYVMLMFL